MKIFDSIKYKDKKLELVEDIKVSEDMKQLLKMYVSTFPLTRHASNRPFHDGRCIKSIKEGLTAMTFSAGRLGLLDEVGKFVETIKPMAGKNFRVHRANTSTPYGEFLITKDFFKKLPDILRSIVGNSLDLGVGTTRTKRFDSIMEQFSIRSEYPDYVYYYESTGEKFLTVIAAYILYIIHLD